MPHTVPAKTDEIRHEEKGVKRTDKRFTLVSSSPGDVHHWESAFMFEDYIS